MLVDIETATHAGIGTKHSATPTTTVLYEARRALRGHPGGAEPKVAEHKQSSTDTCRTDNIVVMVHVCSVDSCQAGLVLAVNAPSKRKESALRGCPLLGRLTELHALSEAH